MTCIVGLVHEGVVYIGGDSAGVGGLSLTVRADEKVSDILARPVLFHKRDVLAISKVLRGTLVKGNASLVVNRDADQRTLIAANDKGETATASEQLGTFPDWRRLIPTEFEADPAALNAWYLQWAARFCEALNDDSGAARIIHLHPTKPARIDAVSDEYRGIAVVMPMFVDLAARPRII